MKSNSREPKYPVNSRVWCSGYWEGSGYWEDGVALIDSAKNSAANPDEFRYGLRMNGYELFYVHESWIRPLKFMEFAIHRHPVTRAWRFGNNSIVWAAIIHVFGLIVFGCGFTLEELVSQLFTHAFGLAIIGLMWLGTWMNYTKRWV